ncbi:MAG: LOW QUALITY PROTEIN: hypothetical protein J3Q66DRAFT_323236 [Benniella sp.]|nr:MAG: LOW QUALITY PROTEIN: hypothetical protein J3Q66DRAFT_323236 [Benniella sp.]
MDKTDKQRGGAAAAGEGAVPKEDFRWAVSLFSGLKQLCTSLLLIFKTPSLYGPLAGLAFRCAVDFFQCQLVKYHFLSGDHNYFFPILLLFRYLIPRHFDEMFAATTKALACDTRPDLVNRRAPPASKQLVQYLSSMIFAYFILGAVSMTLRGYEMALTLNGFWTWSRFGLILVITYHYLQHKKSLRWAIVGTMTCTAVAAPGSLVTAVEFAVQQRLFYHALLQPYLVRVQFKAWQERAWFQQYELELQGFALSAWILCSCHVVGALMVPPVFSAMVCMLSNSCGRMENLGDEQERDIMEKRTPGVKAVALGQSRAVEGHWDAVSVNTFIGNANQPSSSSTSQNLGESGMSSYQHEEMGAVSENQIQKDRQITLERKQNLLNEYRRQHQQFQQQQQQQQSPLPLPQHHHYYHPQAQLNPSFVNPSSPWLTSAPRLVSSIPEASAPPMSPTLAAAAAAAESTGPQSKHGNRKPSETTPPAPPAPSAIPPLRPNHIPGRPDLAQDHPENTRPAGSNPDDATGARPRNFNSFNSAGWMAPPRTGGGGGGGGGDPYNSAAFVSEAFQWPGELGRRFMDQGRRMAEEGRRIAEESQRRANDGRRAMERVFEHAPDALKKGIERMVPGNPQYHPHHGDKQEVEDYEGEETRAAEMDGDLHEKEVVRRRGRRQHREDGSEKLSRRESERANHQASESARPGLHLGRMVSDSIIDTIAGSSASMTGSSPGAVRPRRKAPWQRGGLSEIIAENMQNLDKVITEELEGIGSRMWKRNPHVVRPPSTPPPLPSSHE